MSRAPVREALQTLCSERILTNVPRLGYKVVPIGVRETLDAIDVRPLLEIESARPACRNRSESALAKLDALISQEQKISKLLDLSGIKVFMLHVGEFAASMEMAGLSITVVKLDGELKALLAAPASTPFYTNANK